MGTLCHSVEVLELPDDCDPRPVLIADIIGDAHGDVLVACAEGPLLVFPGQPSGIGEPQMVTDMANAAGPMPLDLAVGYLDGDDRLDIVLVNGVVGEPNVRVFLQTNAGAFIVDPYDAGPRPNQVAIGAWSSPRAPDVFIATMDALVLGHLRNTGNGTFDVAPAIDVGIPQNDVALGRLDGDADVDIAVVSSSPNRLTLVFNQDGLPGGLVPIADNLGTMPTRLLLNDIEPNATLDILYTRGGASGIRVLRGDGSGNFSINEAQNYGDSLRDLDDGDFDGNGLPDAVLADYTGQVLFFLLLLEGPQMEVMDVMLPIDGQPWSLAAGRIDGDLLTDVVVSTDDTHQVVLVQSSP